MLIIVHILIKKKQLKWNLWKLFHGPYLSDDHPLNLFFRTKHDI